MEFTPISKKDKPLCPLCKTTSKLQLEFRERVYLKCENCFSIYMDPLSRLDSSSEKTHYLNHNNDIFDEGYRKFVSPITDYIIENYKPDSKGLDFGSGTGPVIYTVLKEAGYNIDQYDPYFHPAESVLLGRYDYIACCEVVEHFYHPEIEFESLYNKIESGGELICKTDLFDEETDFWNWYYKTDPTHTFFYSKKTFNWIKERFSFNSCRVDGRLVFLRK